LWGNRVDIVMRERDHVASITMDGSSVLRDRHPIHAGDRDADAAADARGHPF
jgi:hypothetical protein